MQYTSLIPVCDPNRMTEFSKNKGPPFVPKPCISGWDGSSLHWLFLFSKLRSLMRLHCKVTAASEK